MKSKKIIGSPRKKGRELYFLYSPKEKAELEDACNTLVYADWHERSWQTARNDAVERLKNRPHGKPIWMGADIESNE